MYLHLIYSFQVNKIGTFLVHENRVAYRVSRIDVLFISITFSTDSTLFYLHNLSIFLWIFQIYVL